MSVLFALSPLDGRYASQVAELREFFSEAALLRSRTFVKIAWLKFLAGKKEITGLRKLNAGEIKFLDGVFQNFSKQDAERIKKIEATTNHDVKAVEYFLKEKCAENSLQDVIPWIHFACTSEDVNNLAYALMLRDGIKKCLLPFLKNLQKNLTAQSRAWKNIAMLARTHGQPASPTTMGKAWLNFSARLQRQIGQLEQQEYLGKINGATGNFNAHVAAFPKVDWLKLSREFVTSLKLSWQPVSDQIEPHDFIAELMHALSRVNTILLDFSRDVWGYIAWGYFGQKVQKGEVGSSTMPHKVNPIDFENAEGNLGIANSLAAHFAEKLPVSRWQRDLTDSTVLRNLGLVFGHILLAVKSLEKGIGKLELRPEKIAADLEENWEVLGEAVQTVMRKNGIPDSYEKLKELTRGKKLSAEAYAEFVKNLKLPEADKKALLALTPATYTGLAAKIVEKFSE